MRDALIGPSFLLLAFNVILLHLLFWGFMIVCVTLGDRIATLASWQFSKTLHGLFFHFALGLIAFAMGNVLLLLLGVYNAVVMRILVIGCCFLLWTRRSALKTIMSICDDAIQAIITQIRAQGWLQIVFYALVIFSCMYIYMGWNLAFIPYSTAWDANHAYLFIPRAWAHHNGIYR